MAERTPEEIAAGLSTRDYSSTQRQRDYLRRLISQFGRLPPSKQDERTCVLVRSLTKWPESLERASMAYASKCIGELRAAVLRGEAE